MGVGASADSELAWTVDHWLSNVLSSPCHRVSRKVTCDDASLPPSKVQGFYSIKVPTDNRTLVRKLFAEGFCLNEFHLAFRLGDDVANFAPARLNGATVSVAEREHIPPLQTIAAECFCDSRFHRDSHIKRGLADKVWQQWISDAVNDENRTVLVARSNGQVSGFISLRPLSSSLVSIDLFGVAPQARRGRIGELLISSARSTTGHQASIVCETETWNVPAVNFYGKLGFASASLYSIFHSHRGPR